MTAVLITIAALLALLVVARLIRRWRERRWLRPARGEALRLLARYHGVEPLPQESDDDLRSRVRRIRWTVEQRAFERNGKGRR
jgi:biopolymer transport protein ExbB/TolQ